MLEQKIQLLKQRLWEQSRLAYSQNTLSGFFYVMYGFVEIIENDPVFSRFIQTKIEEENRVRASISESLDKKEIDKERYYELARLHIPNKFYHEYYCLFKGAHDSIKQDRCKALGVKADNITSGGFYSVDTSDPRHLKHLTKEEADFYTADFEKCIKKIEELINTDQPLLNKIYNEYSNTENKVDNIQLEEKTIKQSNKLKFDKKKSELNIKGITIKIRLRNKLPIDHYILETLFENEFWPQEVYLKDIATDKLGYKQYDSQNDWRTLYRACQHLNEKIKKATKNEVLDFVDCRTGKSAWVKINDKYLIKSPK